MNKYGDISMTDTCYSFSQKGSRKILAQKEILICILCYFFYISVDAIQVWDGIT